jgi:hypothetical protein
MNFLELAEDANTADAALQGAKKNFEHAKKNLDVIQAIRKRTHDALTKELSLHAYVADDAMVKRAKRAASFNDRARKRAYEIATGTTHRRSQWIEIDDGDECDQDDCREKSTHMNVFTQECCCDDCAKAIFYDNFSLSDLLDDEEDIELPADTAAFEWRALSEVGDLKCALCDKPPTRQFIGSKHLRCEDHYPIESGDTLATP